MRSWVEVTEREEFVEVPESRLRTVTTGAGRPIVLCHGGPGHWDHMGPTAAMIDDLATVHRYDQRACGESTGGSPFDVATFVADLDALRGHWDHPTWVVGGESWGANLALIYALTDPDCVDGLIYVSGTGIETGWHDEYHAERLRRLAPADRKLSVELWERLQAAEGDELEDLDKRYRRLMAPTDFADPAMVAAYEASGAFDRLANRHVNRAVSDDWRRIVETRDLGAELRALRVPALVVHGARDARPLRLARNVADQPPNARFALIEDCGHDPSLEQPDALKAELRSFIGDLTR